METYEQELFMEIALVAQKRYSHMNEVLRLTKEIADNLSRDDQVTVQMLLGMRGEELEAIGDCEKSINLLLEGSPEGCRAELTSLLAGNKGQRVYENVLSNKIASASQNTKCILKQTIDLDKCMSCRLAGESSFYTEL